MPRAAVTIDLSDEQRAELERLSRTPPGPNRVVAKALEPPPEGTSHWSVHDLARCLSLPTTTVHRILRDNRVKPHQVKTFKYSKNPERAAKVYDIVGLYLDPREGAVFVADCSI